MKGIILRVVSVLAVMAIVVLGLVGEEPIWFSLSATSGDDTHLHLAHTMEGLVIYRYSPSTDASPDAPQVGEVTRIGVEHLRAIACFFVVFPCHVTQMGQRTPTSEVEVREGSLL